MSYQDDHFLPGVSFAVDGESIPARELAWAMYAKCGCVSGLHMITSDVMTEDAAWKWMSGNSREIKRDRDRGFTIRMVKHRDVPFDDCTHSPKWGYMPPPTPAGHSWATTGSSRSLHLVPLEKAEAGADTEWVEAGDAKWWLTEVTSLCGKASDASRLWSRKRHRTEGKVECARCLKLVEERGVAVSRVPWFRMLRDCLCGHPAHPENTCGTEWCKCVKYIEDTDEYPIGEVLCS